MKGFPRLDKMVPTADGLMREVYTRGLANDDNRKRVAHGKWRLNFVPFDPRYYVFKSFEWFESVRKPYIPNFGDLANTTSIYG